MTLTTTGIRRYGEKLYRRLAEQDRLSPDACADAYEMFTRRMRSYRDRHPEAESVPAAFVSKCERWIKTDLLRRQKARRLRETADLEIAKQGTREAEAGAGTGNTHLFTRLEGFFRHWTGENRKAAGFARIFLLYHAWHLSAGRVRLFAPLVDGRKSDFVRDVKRVKKHVAERCAARAADRLRAAQYWYARGVRAGIKAGEAGGRARGKLESIRSGYEARQRRALSDLAGVTYRPEIERLAEITGVKPDRVRYILKLCKAEMKKYFQ